MPRNEQTFIGNAAYGSMVRGGPQILNLAEGGFMGWSPDFGNYLSEQGYVRKPLELVVIESPKFFNLMPNPEQWQSSFRNMIERKVYRADGWQAGLKVDVDEHAVGGSGEFMQEPTDSKRDRTVPSLTYVERYGRPIQRFHDIWIRWGIMDPAAKYAMLATLGARAPGDLLADWRGATILAYEPDPIRGGIEKAWLTTNFYPMSNGPVEGVRDLTEAAALNRITIEYAGMSAVGAGIDMFAQEIMRFTNSANADPYNTAAFVSEIAPDVLAAANAGFKAGMAQTAASNVAPMPV